MGNLSRRMRLCSGVSLSALILVLSTGGSANAQLADDAKLKALQAQIDQLQRTVNELKAAQSQTANEAKAAKKQASEAEAEAANAKATAADAHAKSHKAPAILGLGDIDSNGHRFLEKKPGKDLTFYYARRRYYGLWPTRRFARWCDKKCQVGSVYYGLTER